MNQEQLLQLFYDFHEHPETGHQEFRTTKVLKEILTGLGAELLPLSLPTGVIAVVRGKRPGKSLLVKADIDGLPITEQTGLPYASQIPGKMHACGHDFHMAATLGVVDFLARHKEVFSGNVYFVFEPAEEVTGGAVELLDTGNVPPCTEFLGFHGDPSLPAGTLGLKVGSVMASTDTFRITLKGVECHAAMPHKGKNPIPLLFGLGQELTDFAGQGIDPIHSYVLSITEVHAGESWNIIPQEGWLGGTIRCENPEDRLLLKQNLYKLSKGYAAIHGAGCDIYWHAGAPAVVNDESFVEAARATALKAGWTVVPAQQQMTGDDFSHYKIYAEKAAPTASSLLSLYIKIGIGVGAPLHNAGFKADPAVLSPFASYLAELIQQRLEA